MKFEIYIFLQPKKKQENLNSISIFIIMKKRNETKLGTSKKKHEWIMINEVKVFSSRFPHSQSILSVCDSCFISCCQSPFSFKTNDHLFMHFNFANFNSTLQKCKHFHFNLYIRINQNHLIVTVLFWQMSLSFVVFVWLSNSRVLFYISEKLSLLIFLKRFVAVVIHKCTHITNIMEMIIA